ncbi:MAG: hypothetical protein ACKN9V_07810, partial [Pseudomonadota bacterium]
HSLVQAAPCCGGPANVPSLISGDDESQLTTTFSLGSVVAEAPVGGGIKYRKENDHEDLQTFRIDGAVLLSDRTQAGLSIPIVRRARSRGSFSSDSMGLGDVAINVGYELLTEWNYNSWEPRGIVFISGTLPTGGSIYDAKEIYKVDSRGRGFWGLSSGFLFTKVIGNCDMSLLVEGHHGFSRKIENELGLLKLNPGWGGSGLFALGLSPGGGNLRLGLSVAPSLEEPIETEGLVSGKGELVKLWNASAQVSYLPSRTSSISLIYSDQTVIRFSENSALNRSFAFLYQTRWER